MAKQNPQIDRKIITQSIGALYRPGDVIGRRYEVDSFLGSGGFGEVYLVYDRGSNNVYALKTFRDEFLADIKTRELFKKEASLLVELGNHPFLVRTYFVDQISGRLLIAMEFIAPDKKGINSLAGYLQNRSLELAQSLRWAIQICLGMEYAYSKGIRVHRDIKPENIMIAQDGTAKITDFGLAGVSHSPSMSPTILTGNIDQSGKTQRGVGFGTPTHMPPEQYYDAASCDVRSDIYAIGIVLFQMATNGQLPFLATPPRDGSQVENMRFWLEMQRLHNEASVPRLKSPLFNIIQRCLEKQPDKRYQSFSHLRSELEPILARNSGEVIYLPKAEELTAWEFFAKGDSLTALGRYEDALPYYDQAAKINPRSTLVWARKGNCLYFLGRYEEAIFHCDKALELDPRNTLALNAKANSLDGLGRYEEAIQCYQNALKIDPLDTIVMANEANSLCKLDRYEEAIRCCDKALEIDPCFSGPLFTKAVSLERLGHYEESVLFYDKALEINPLDTITWCNKGISLQHLGRYEESIPCYDKAIEINPRDADSYYNKGLSLWKLGCNKEAFCYYDKALEIDPRHEPALNDKAVLLSQLDRFDESIHCLDQALTINSDLGNLEDMAKNFFNMALVYARQGKLFIALPLVQQSAQLYDLNNDPRRINALTTIAEIKAARSFPLNLVIEKIQNVTSHDELQKVLIEYSMINPEIIELFRRGIPDIVPPHARSAYRQHLEWLVPIVNSVAQSAHELFFYQVDSLSKLHLAIRRYPFMLEDRFLEVVEQVIYSQLPQNRSTYEQLLNWLKQIASQG